MSTSGRIAISMFGAIFFALPLIGSVEGTWCGTLDAMGQKLQLVFHIKEDKCMLDSPDQGAFGIVGRIVSAKEMDTELSFKAIGGTYSGKIEKGSLCGTWKQGGMSFPLNMKRTEKKIVRPQEPKPPFPYRTEDVVFTNAEARLSGTLTLPKGFTRKTPAVVMVTGSGPQNRDEELFGHRPFAVIADFLARHGIASLRYDDRGCGKSVGKIKDISIENIALDAESGADCLRSRFDHVGILGHSEGGTVGFMLGRQGKVDFIVSLAGSSMKLKDVLDWQLRRKLKNLGRSKRQIEKELPSLKRSFMKDDGIRRYMEYDSVQDIKGIRCPVFALNGERDTQVSAKDHLGIFKRNISVDVKAKIKSYPELNHMFQPCITGEANEYAQIEQTISPEVLSDIVAFIKELHE
ncbi:MAG: alpha/beta hydrolase [Kiritimatiellae bacterium]|nr:alpha/beta hydrolase [Kiritimatiellia bacterium]